MRIIVRCLLALLLSIPLAAFGQAEHITELENSLAATTGQNRIALLLRLGQLEIDANESKKQAKHFQRAIKFLEEGVKMAQNPPFEDLEAEVKGLELLGIICQKNNAENRTIGQLKNKCGQTEKALALAMRKRAEILQEDISNKNSALRQMGTEKNRISKERNQLKGKVNISNDKNDSLSNALDTLELRTQVLKDKIEKDSLKQELLLSKQKELEGLVSLREAELKQQQIQKAFLAVGLFALLIISILIFLNYRLQKKRTTEKAKMQHQLLVQDKMATLGQLAVGIAHEIKNPLNFVNNFAEGSSSLTEELLETLVDNKDKVPTDQYELMEEVIGEIKQNASDIAHHGQRADRIVKSMMEHSRGEMGSPEPTDINRLLVDNLALAFNGYRGMYPDFNTDIQKELAPSLPTIEVIPQGLSRVFINILNNACYALHKKVQANLEAYQPILRISTEAYDQGVEIRIYDNGIGIPPDIQAKIFDPFFTSKPTGDGNTGLGLYFSYDIIVKAHGGDLALKSEVGSYTEFIIKIPHIQH